MKELEGRAELWHTDQLNAQLRGVAPMNCCLNESFLQRFLSSYVFTRRNWGPVTKMSEIVMSQRKQSNKDYVEKCLHAREREVKEGDAVLS